MSYRAIAKKLEFPIGVKTDGPKDERFLGKFEDLIFMSVFYVVSISILSLYMRSRRNAKPPQPYNVKMFSVVHNFIMGLYSLVSAIATIFILYENWKESGFDPLMPFCDTKKRVQKDMDYWLYLFYLSKFLEFLDTYFLILKAKPVWPPGNSQYFLHVFHHTTTASIVFVAWRYRFSAGWVGPITNCFVHTFMYFYYFATDINIISNYWGGIIITPIQIIQFIVCMLSVLYETIFFEKCQTDLYPILWLWFCYVVFLGFFVVLFNEKKSNREKSKPKTE